MGVEVAIGIGVASLFGGIVGSSMSSKASYNASQTALKGQREANDTNLQINRETNQTNMQLAEKQNQWNIDQWNRENEYNSPANQMRLYQNAGLNPNLVTGDFVPANSIQSAELANQIPTQIQNPYAQSAPLGLQGALQSSQALKGLIGDSADILKKFSDIRKTEVETGALKQITPSQLKVLDAQVRHLNANADNIEKLTPAQFEELSAKITNFRKQYVLMEKDERNKELLNESIELQNKLVKAQWNDLVKLPKAQLELSLANAFMARAQGNKANFETGFMRKHGRTVPTNALDQFINLVFDGLDEFGVNPKQVVEFLKKRIGFDGDDGDNGSSSRSMYQLGGSLFKILKNVGNGVVDFSHGIADEIMYFAFPSIMPARKSDELIDRSQFE